MGKKENIGADYVRYTPESELDTLLLKIPLEEIDELKEFVKEEFGVMFNKEYKFRGFKELGYSEEKIKKEIDSRLNGISIEVSSKYPTLLKEVDVKNGGITEGKIHVDEESGLLSFELEDFIKGVKLNDVSYDIIVYNNSSILDKNNQCFNKNNEIKKIFESTLENYFKILEKYDNPIKGNNK